MILKTTADCIRCAGFDLQDTTQIVSGIVQSDASAAGDGAAVSSNSVGANPTDDELRPRAARGANSSKIEDYQVLGPLSVNSSGQETEEKEAVTQVAVSDENSPSLSMDREAGDAGFKESVPGVVLDET